MGKAVAQIREVADYLQTLAVQADVLNVKYELESDQGCELAYLLKKVKALSIRAKLYPGTSILHTEKVQSYGSKIGKIGTNAERNTGTDASANARTGTSAPLNFPTGSCCNPEDNRANPTVPDFDEVAEVGKAVAEFPKRLEDRYKWLEEKFKALESDDYHCEMDARKLSPVPDLVLPPNFKMAEFEKYNGTSFPEAYIMMFCQRMTGHVNNDQLLIHCFQDSLARAAAKWYNQLSRTQVKSWKDLAQAFMKQYGHVTDIALDRITLQNMEKKSNESFRQYAQRWKEIATQV
ncbi:uncharacterized protein LOC108455412 [Gossypium arboreum]|uniref:uncharacterized protein LOC108455412 n=1 Tax=Gossypium arboreum TaxID=29729 RepID=UPI000818F51A|nr:uncharacterized protein LOC108455412 [Gossypium arboreum]